MAKEDKNGKGEEASPKKKKKKGGLVKTQLLIPFGIIAAVIFLPTSVVLAAGMLPTFVVAFVDRTKQKTQAITVGAMNLAACSPFVLEMWVQDHTIERALLVITDPASIIIMYVGACIGYMIDWSVTGMVATLMYRRGLSKQESLARRRQELIERWGREVTGNIPLDDDGFPVEIEDKKPKSVKEKK